MSTVFRDSFNYYKSKETSLKEVLTFNMKYEENKIVKKVASMNYNSLSLFGLTHPNEWEIYELISNPGLIFIKNPFTAIGQRYWIIRCLRDYPKKPNKTNLDNQSSTLQDKELLYNCTDLKLRNKLRWATIGYHHNWDTKVYSEDSKNKFPLDLQILSKHVAAVLGFDSFNPEAAIVNFYHMNSRLSGHTDHSEQCSDSPLFSFSFGQTAIFLLGGVTTDVKPTAMFLNSGDVVVMSKESRLSYHGIPKIIKTCLSPWVDINCDPKTDDTFEHDIITNCVNNSYWKFFDNYINLNRININVRQVLRKDQQKLCF